MAFNEFTKLLSFECVNLKMWIRCSKLLSWFEIQLHSTLSTFPELPTHEAFQCAPNTWLLGYQAKITFYTSKVALTFIRVKFLKFLTDQAIQCAANTWPLGYEAEITFYVESGPYFSLG